MNALMEKMEAEQMSESENDLAFLEVAKRMVLNEQAHHEDMATGASQLTEKLQDNSKE